MFTLVVTTNENYAKHNSEWAYISDHWYRRLITGGSRSGKTSALLI